MTQSFAVLLPKTLPQEIREFLSASIFETESSTILLARKFEVEGYFAALELIRNDTSKKMRRVRLPIQYVLAVADLTAEDSKSFGFV